MEDDNAVFLVDLVFLIPMLHPTADDLGDAHLCFPACKWVAGHWIMHGSTTQAAGPLKNHVNGQDDIRQSSKHCDSPTHIPSPSYTLRFAMRSALPHHLMYCDTQRKPSP